MNQQRTTGCAFRQHVVQALCLLGCTLTLGAALASEEIKRPAVDTSGLPALAAGWAEVNPLRGNALAIDIGREAFNQTCARCHGENANGSRSPAPDLRRIGSTCLRIQDAALKQRCQSDADHFFITSVRFGKQKFGIVHMPPWDTVLEPTLIWSLRTYVENAPR
jgi:cytochrome c553